MRLACLPRVLGSEKFILSYCNVRFPDCVFLARKAGSTPLGAGICVRLFSTVMSGWQSYSLVTIRIPSVTIAFYRGSAYMQEDKKTIDRLLYRPREVAEITGIALSYVYRLIASGDLPSLRHGRLDRKSVV